MSDLEFDMEDGQNELIELETARVIRVKQGMDQNEEDTRLTVDVEMNRGGEILDIPFFGGTVDRETKKPHGVFMAPRVDSLMAVMFVKGNSEDPIGCFSVPYPSWNHGDDEYEDFYDILDDVDDIGIFHFSGTKMKMKKDGKITMSKDAADKNDPANELEITFNETKNEKIIKDVNNNITITLNEDKMKIETSGSQVLELGKGTMEKIVRGETFKSVFNNHIHSTPAGPSSTPTIPMPSSALSQLVFGGE
jgi:hypothetical protein